LANRRHGQGGALHEALLLRRGARQIDAIPGKEPDCALRRQYGDERTCDDVTEIMSADCDTAQRDDECDKDVKKKMPRPQIP
jgi:hypothetical protein